MGVLALIFTQSVANSKSLLPMGSLLRISLKSREARGFSVACCLGKLASTRCADCTDRLNPSKGGDLSWGFKKKGVFDKPCSLRIFASMTFLLLLITFHPFVFQSTHRCTGRNFG